MKQTAVEWLLEQIFKHNNLVKGDGWFYVKPDIIEQAKAMEKEHMIGFHKWMLENDTEQNAEKHFHFTDNDMLDEYYKWLI